MEPSVVTLLKADVTSFPSTATVTFSALKPSLKTSGSHVPTSSARTSAFTAFTISACSSLFSSSFLLSEPLLLSSFLSLSELLLPPLFSSSSSADEPLFDELLLSDELSVDELEPPPPPPEVLFGVSFVLALSVFSAFSSSDFGEYTFFPSPVVFSNVFSEL